MVYLRCYFYQGGFQDSLFTSEKALDRYFRSWLEEARDGGSSKFPNNVAHAEILAAVDVNGLMMAQGFIRLYYRNGKFV